MVLAKATKANLNPQEGIDCNTETQSRNAETQSRNAAIDHVWREAQGDPPARTHQSASFSGTVCPHRLRDTTTPQYELRHRTASHNDPATAPATAYEPSLDGGHPACRPVNSKSNPTNRASRMLSCINGNTSSKFSRVTSMTISAILPHLSERGGQAQASGATTCHKRHFRACGIRRRNMT